MEFKLHGLKALMQEASRMSVGRTLLLTACGSILLLAWNVEGVADVVRALHAIAQPAALPTPER